FKEEHTPRPQFFSSLFRKLSNSDASFLELSISLDEVKEALWSCASSKSPGPNGINFHFTKSYWDVLKSTFWDYVKCFKASGSFSKGCNPLFIVLILKKSDPSDSRIIVPQILDGRLIANEIIQMDHLKDRKLLLFKGDFEKAFDSWIRSFLLSASISILINGSPTKEFSMERGLQQGDPLSPLLFLLVAKSLQVSIMEACNKGIFKGLKVNLGKSRIFGIGVPNEDVETVASSLGYVYGVLPFIYLGLPVGKKLRLCDG
ncbi:putative RNA-directed DNA polymerase, eukaryota, reverse transcriptase zinc-binding domain protein, partial [Tanacetum coccineum]